MENSKPVPKAQYRITHPDPHNWCIEEFQTGGGTVERGRYAGQVKQERWKAAALFYPTLRHAALALIDKAAGDAILNGECTSILEALKLAETRVLATLAVLEMGVACPAALTVPQ